MTTPYPRSQSAAAPQTSTPIIPWLARHWLPVAVAAIGLYVGLPWLAPVFMALGWSGAASVIYAIYSTQCHQLPERSYFLFGPQLMYPLADIQAAWQDTANPLILRQFVGDAALGWKVAWSDRMVSLYTSVFAASLGYWPLRGRLRALPWPLFVALALPMVIDGATHFVSDLAGIGRGFRDSNAWLVSLTGGAFPAWFYAGDAVGSLNWWLRLITGGLFGIGLVWMAYPHLDTAFTAAARDRQGEAPARR